MVHVDKCCVCGKYDDLLNEDNVCVSCEPRHTIHEVYEEMEHELNWEMHQRVLEDQEENQTEEGEYYDSAFYYNPDTWLDVDDDYDYDAELDHDRHYHHDEETMI